jgi:hypothetical protein
LGESEEANHLPISQTLAPSKRADYCGDDRNKEENGEEAISKFNPRMEGALGLVRNWGD